MNNVNKNDLRDCCTAVEVRLDWICVCQSTDDHITDNLLDVSGQERRIRQKTLTIVAHPVMRVNLLPHLSTPKELKAVALDKMVSNTQQH